MEQITPKQQAIINAYGEYYDKVKGEMLENGFVPYRLMEGSTGVTFEFKQYHIVYGNPEPYVRPSSLKGIDNNNGWIRIESEDDLPKESGMYHTYYADGVVSSRYFNKEKNDWTTNPKATHYQPIKKPLPPIY